VTVSDKLYEAFKNWIVANKENGLTAENLSGQVDYSKMRLREELVTATYSNEAGVQVLLEADPQLAKAVESMPEAKKMSENIAYTRK